MNIIIERLKGGDIRSDGEADDVAVDVLNHPILFAQLYAGLAAPDDVVRGRSAHALEHVSRSKPELLLPYLNKLVDQSTQDPLPMVRWHLAMIFANLSVFEDRIDTLAVSLFRLLDDDSVFVKSWTISGLTIIGKHYPHLHGKVVERIKVLRIDGSKAIQTRVRNALDVLENDVEIPAGWVKSELLKNVKTEFTGDSS
ncbi:MAG: hypothetical protein MUO67_13160 [Anaerolineales bacterium]|nr:hypothetical protein [Anaerolineales bacterium]